MSQTATADQPAATATTDRPAASGGDRERLVIVEQFVCEAARLCRDTRCSDVKVIDVTGHSQLTDYVLLATGTSDRQLRTVMDDLYDLADERGIPHLGGRQRHGTMNTSWVAIDFIDAMAHLFSSEARGYYDLDSLHAEGRLVKWAEDEPAGDGSAEV